MKKTDVEEYIKRVKQNNPNGVVLCIDTEKGTQEKVKTNGAFNVYFQMDEKVYIDFLGKGFDMGAITKGKENHECWIMDWDEILFVKPSNMNQYRQYKISDEEYIYSARRRLQHLLNIGFSPDEIRGKVPKNYTQMPLWIKEKILDDIVMPIYLQKEELRSSGLVSFGVQGMIIGEKIVPIEFNRRERFAEKSIFERMER